MDPLTSPLYGSRTAALYQPKTGFSTRSAALISRGLWATNDPCAQHHDPPPKSPGPTRGPRTPAGHFSTRSAAASRTRAHRPARPRRRSRSSPTRSPRSSSSAAAEMHYLVGMAYSKGNALDKAISHLAAAVNADVAEEDARFQLASAQDRVGQWAKARAEYDKFATAHPQSPNAVFAMRRSATLAHMPAVAPWNAPAKPGTPTPVPSAPAPATPPPAAQ